jgi:hypothetical protein
MAATLAWLLLHLAASGELAHDPRVLSFCRVLVRNALVERDREHGAFVVRTADEEMLYFVVWPPSGEKNNLRWYGRFPDGTIAILHTHEGWASSASKRDRNTARIARIPVYVVTQFRITKTTGGPSVVVMDNWLSRTGREVPHD